ncbi:JAB domain-containing protein [Maribacter polysiphoniae]|uniref:JAB domain-containing protein n=1 Tax=Maribacter polysiphoniae TaxID=429344 RepID=A0A316EFI2_9FLAO|nr:JAB domain-containing protein [Maribacter polysiphoniae]MBD1261984.1 JAB domain-containing protein [Maribacter polysiphoniae]PWK21670.1 RadC-like JAB domain-containing protein [Maribacter polysiphoniae]
MRTQVREIKVSYQDNIGTKKSHTINSSKAAASLIFDDWDKNTIELQECFKVLLLNNSNKVKGIYQISQGGLTGTLVDLRILFAVVLKSLSVGIILSHNHPSGKMKPSEQDISLTKKIKKAADYFDIKLLDHIILAPNGSYFSFTDDGIL